jgi:DNA-binding MarR family transcriptional regulator
MSTTLTHRTRRDVNVKAIDISSEAGLNEALELLHRAWRAVVARPDRLLARRGLGRVHHRILYVLGRQPGTTAGALARRLVISRQALSGPLRTLLAKRLVVARAGEHDRRHSHLELTSRGAALEVAVSGDQRRRFARVFADLGADTAAAWKAVMRELAEAPPPHQPK